MDRGQQGMEKWNRVGADEVTQEAKTQVLVRFHHTIVSKLHNHVGSCVFSSLLFITNYNNNC